eukprot:scaffold4844_cov112-Cylindrotheca_fusiformis.AAC.8
MDEGGQYSDPSSLETRQVEANSQDNDFSKTGSLEAPTLARNVPSDSNLVGGQEGDQASSELQQIEAILGNENVHMVRLLEEMTTPVIVPLQHGNLDSVASVPTSVDSSMTGLNHEAGNILSQLCACYISDFRRRFVTWQHPSEEGVFSACYVCPFSGKLFFSGRLLLEPEDYIGFPGDDLHWYREKTAAVEAAAARSVDHFRSQGQESNDVLHRHRQLCFETTVSSNDDGSPLPALLPPKIMGQIARLRSEVLIPDSRSANSSAISPLSDPTSFRPDSMEGALTMRAPTEDRDPKRLLHERYRKGCIPPASMVVEVDVPETNFVVKTIGNEQDRAYTCFFVCPLFGEVFLSGELRGGGMKHSTPDGLKWYRSIKKAKKAAAGVALDCFDYRKDHGLRRLGYCLEPPYERRPEQEVLLDDIIDDIIPSLQADAEERHRRCLQPSTQEDSDPAERRLSILDSACAACCFW